MPVRAHRHRDTAHLARELVVGEPAGELDAFGRTHEGVGPLLVAGGNGAEEAQLRVGQRRDEVLVALAGVEEPEHADRAGLGGEGGVDHGDGQADHGRRGGRCVRCRVRGKEGSLVLGVHHRDVGRAGERAVDPGASLVAGGALLWLRDVVQAHGKRPAVQAGEQGVGGVAEKVVGEGDVDGLLGQRSGPERLLPDDVGARCAGQPERVLGHPVAVGAHDEMFHARNPRFSPRFTIRSAWRSRPCATSAGRWR